MADRSQRYFVVPHTHWDREWYRPFEHFRLRLGGVVDEVLDTLEDDPDFTSFTLDGQAIVLEDYVAVRPENEPRLRALIAAGRIEVGPSYVLPDEFLVGGEPLVRNLLIGRAVCRRFGAEPSPAGYLPDSFGHPLQLPQILAGFGIKSFLFSRGLGDEIDVLGVAFNWVAPDGSAVRALQLLGDYSNFANVIDADDAQARVQAISERFGHWLAAAGAHEVVLCNGTDHWRIQPQMPAVCAELERRFPDSAFEIAGYGDYVRALRTGELPSFTGELLGSRLWNVLRGVNSARLYLKQANEAGEQRILAVETLAAVIALGTGGRFPAQDLTLAWRELLKCQPHDSICGCSCDEVHRDVVGRYASLHRTLDAICDSAVAALGRREAEGQVSLFNPLPFERAQLLRLPDSAPALVHLAGFEARTVKLAPPPQPEIAPGPSHRIQSDRFAVSVADGTVTVQDLRDGPRFAGLHVLEDELDMGDLYNFCPVEGTGVWRCSEACTRVLSNGPVSWELEISYRGRRPEGLDAKLRPRPETVAVAVTTVVRLTRASDRIEFQTTIDNAGQDHRLRAVFAAGDAGGPVRAEGQFAVIERPISPPQPRTPWCEPPDPTQHAIGAVALGPVALLTRGLPEYEVRHGDAGPELCLTLLRCVGLISRPSDAIATRPLGAGPDLPTPEGQCPGLHVLDYALTLDAEVLDEVALLRASQDYRSPFVLLPAGIDFAPSLALEGEVVFSCLKGAEDGEDLVLRAFNPARRPARATVRGSFVTERVRLDETNPSLVPDGIVELGPGEIATLRLRL